MTVPLAQWLGETVAAAAASAAAARVLCVAADAGILAELRRALDGGADPNALATAKKASGEEFETTALVAAAGKGHLKAVILLLERGASPDKPNSGGITSLMAAAATGQAVVLGLLAERGADLHATDPGGSTAFHYACFHNQPGCMEALVRAGCNTTAKTKGGQTGTQLAERQGHTDVLECLARMAKKQPAARKQTHPRAKQPEKEAFRQPHPAHLEGVGEKREKMALCEAARTGNLGAIRRALEAGLEPNALIAVKTAAGTEHETTALIEAATHGQLEAAALMLDRGASPDKPDSRGDTPLMTAAIQGSAAMVGLLLEHGADPKAVDPEGSTAFHFACCGSQGTGCVEALVRAGACDMTAKNEDGQTGKQVAEENGKTAVLECLARMAKKAAKNKKKRDRKRRQGTQPVVQSDAA